MLSSLETPVYDEPSPEKITALREYFGACGIDMLIVPHADEYQNSHLAPCAERLAWLTHFTGSAGTAIIGREYADLFVDGRYVTQAADETEGLTIHWTKEQTPEQWMAECLGQNVRLGVDPALHSFENIRELRSLCEKTGASLVLLQSNLVDEVWKTRPEPPRAPIVPHPIEYTGKGSQEKRNDVSAVLREDGHDAAIIILPDSIAWLLNIRGGDLPITPLPFSRLIIHQNGCADLFLNPVKVTDDLERHLGEMVRIKDDGEFEGALHLLGKQRARVRIEPKRCPASIAIALEESGAILCEGEDPCQLPKAIKTKAETSGARRAHFLDGVALTRFLFWLEHEIQLREIDELSAAAKLTAIREECPELKSLSFRPISCAGPNSALPHYLPKKTSNRKLKRGELFLIDSGGQYLFGTTDVTRTIAIGTPTEEMRDRFTRVLKGHIALARATFPCGTTGAQLDILTRLSLWEEGLDYSHGAGHGIGSYLGVHEGPQRISSTGTLPLMAGMLVSNEPGYYKQGDFGIRIENVVLVNKVELPGHHTEMLCMDTLTLAPIDQRLIDAGMLTSVECDWLDSYHEQVYSQLRSALSDQEGAWLREVTKPIDRRA